MTSNDIVSIVKETSSSTINTPYIPHSHNSSAFSTIPFTRYAKKDEVHEDVCEVPLGRMRPKPERPPDLQFDFQEMLADLRRELSAKRSEEAKIMRNMDEMIQKASASSGGADVTRTFNLAVTRFNNQMALVESDAKQLANSLKMISGLADNISGKVSTLDVTKGRVVECLQRVSDLMDLRTCAEGVKTAMDDEDYELAAQHIYKFLTLDTAVFQMGDQVDAKDAGQSMKYNYDVLREATASLKSIIESKFDEAVVSGDVASMQRFFKLFPLINEHSSGITRFGKYLCQEIRKFAESNYKVMLAGGTDDKRMNVLYADSLTMLFEGIAREIQVHEPLIDSFYGPDKMLSLIEMLQVECDKESERIIAAFIKNRQYESKAKLVEKCSRNPDKYASSEKMDALELDVVLSEVTLMHTRAELYWRYLRRRLDAANAKTDEHRKEATNEDMTEEDRRRMEEAAAKEKVERDRKLDNLLNRSLLGTRMQELLGRYILMEEYYMKESVAKAMNMDTRESDSLISSMLDDVFFIVRKCVRRSLSSSSVDCVCAMLNNGATALEVDFLEFIHAGIKAGYPSVGWTAEAYQTAQTAYNVIQHGKTVADAGPEKQKEAFVTALNNVRASADCVKTLKRGLAEDFEKHLTQLTTLEKGKLENAMAQFDDLVRKFDNAANIGVEKLCAAAFRPKLKTSAELYLDVTHSPTESEFADFEAVDPFMDGFIASLDKQLAVFEPLLVPSNYQELLSSVCAEVNRQLERVILKSSFNRLGGLQLDREFRSLTSYLTGIAGWMLREKCARLSQVVSLINVESVDEAVDFYQQLQQHNRLLSGEEAKKLRCGSFDYINFFFPHFFYVCNRYCRVICKCLFLSMPDR
uniref:Conserved oligomeric Golgi complex subunit 4 n=2 Tax=Parascaris TaxID=6254 RepID=A0A915CIL2_PARUN